MRYVVTFLLFFVSVCLKATVYYVAPTGGSDSNDGTNIAAPWATWGKAFTSANDNDTVYFRGGVYSHTITNGTGYEVTVDGTAGNLIYFLNYPGEVPILDCDNVTSATGDVNVAIDISGVNYVKFRGLVVRNVWQFDGNDTGVGWLSWGATGTIFERCVTYNIHGIGFLQYGAWDVHYINCDAYNCADSLSTTRPGNTGSGFQYVDFADTNTSTYYTGCRAWNCSDQGFALGSAGYTEYDNCWSWGNGYLTGEGDGFKLGWMGAGSATLQILVKNCFAAFNSEAGFNDNSSTGDPAGFLNIYNNTSYDNGQYGYMFFNTSSNDAAELNRITRNNIAYGNPSDVFNQTGSLYTHEYNSWDLPVTITNTDFASIDSTGISGARQSDGSLPVVSFLTLAFGSDLIDAGIDVGLLYSGSGPDLGYAEYDGEVQDDATDIIIFTLPTQTGAATINTTNHTVAIEVSYLATVTNLTPYISLSYGATISPASMTSRDFTTPQTYTVTALDGTTTQNWTVTVTQEEEPVDPEPPADTSRIIKFNGGHLRKFRP